MIFLSVQVRGHHGESRQDHQDLVPEAWSGAGRGGHWRDCQVSIRNVFLEKESWIIVILPVFRLALTALKRHSQVWNPFDYMCSGIFYSDFHDRALGSTTPTRGATSPPRTGRGLSTSTGTGSASLSGSTRRWASLWSKSSSKTNREEEKKANRVDVLVSSRQGGADGNEWNGMRHSRARNKDVDTKHACFDISVIKFFLRKCWDIFVYVVIVALNE